eukprot:COSAG02_NODE_257_length_26838_cov_118.324844_13_plen_89_part_00
MRRGAPFDTCFALSASICIVASLVYWYQSLVWLCIRYWCMVAGRLVSSCVDVGCVGLCRSDGIVFQTLGGTSRVSSEMGIFPSHYMRL